MQEKTGITTNYNIKSVPFDLTWKSLSTAMFPQFMNFFLPLMAEEYNCEDAVFLEKELNHVYKYKIHKARYFKRYMDKLIRIPHKSNPKRFTYVHFEAQEVAGKGFIRRVLEYIMLAYLDLKIPITTIAILSTVTKDYSNKINADYHRLGYTFVLEDYQILQQNEVELKESDNPFALVILGAYTRLKSNKGNVSETVEKFYWIYAKLMKLGLDIKQIELIWYFLEKNIKLSLIDIKTLNTFTEELILLTKNVEIMSIDEMFKNQGKAEGKVEGKIEGKIEGIQGLLSNPNLKVTLSEIAHMFKVSVDFVRKVKMEMESSAVKLDLV